MQEQCDIYSAYAYIAAMALCIETLLRASDIVCNVASLYIITRHFEQAEALVPEKKQSMPITSQILHIFL